MPMRRKLQTSGHAVQKKSIECFDFVSCTVNLYVAAYSKCSMTLPVQSVLSLGKHSVPLPLLNFRVVICDWLAVLMTN